MVIDSDIRNHAYQFFIQEAPELLQVIEAELLTLKTQRSPAKIHNLMRAAHSIKGGAASVGLEAIKTLAHSLEDIFKSLHHEEVEIDAEVESLLLSAYDCLRLPLMEQVTTGNFDQDQAMAKAEPVFAKIEARLGDFLQGVTELPSSIELGVDIALSIFEVDIAQGLERLSRVIANSQAQEVEGELRALAEVFAGIAELLSLPGFGAIANTALAALDAAPAQALEIAEIALADFSTAQQTVLAGDRTTGGAPSPALVAFTIPAVTFSEPVGITAPLAFEQFMQPELEPSLVDSSEQALNLELLSIPSLEEVFGNFLPEVEPQATPTPEITATTGAEENIQQVVASIEQTFDALPLIEADYTPATEPTTKESPLVVYSPAPLETTAASVPTTPVGTSQSVRVDLERLERINNLVGELSINRNSLSLQNEQLQGTIQELKQRFAKFQAMGTRLRALSDQMLVAPERYNSRLARGSEFSLSAGQPNSRLAEFDSLEMDSYGELNSLLQATFEEIMQLQETVGDVVLIAGDSSQSLEQQRQMLGHLRDDLMWARMLPLSEVFNRFPRILRDLSTAYDKPVELKISGTGVLVDKAAIEKLYDPLLHLLRNAFDHGIELPGTRVAQGKQPQGQIEIRAYHQGSQTIIEVRDDGQGINLERVRSKALALGLLSPEQIATASPARLLEVLFEPGFSTANQVSELSGRGVGLDVVRAQVRFLKGTVTLTTEPGHGTTFTLRIPLTLTITKLLICFAGSSTFAFPSDSIAEILIPQPEQVKHLGGKRFLQWQEQLVPACNLSELMEYACPLPPVGANRALTTVPTPEEWALPMLLLNQDNQILALEVDRLVMEQELVIKSLGALLQPPPYIYGCTILGDGSLIPVIDSASLLESFIAQNRAATVANLPEIAVKIASLPPTRPAIQRETAPTLLVVDDSITARQTLVFTLEKAGYQVLQAGDGREAIKQLQQHRNVKLVICDIEMPHMNGFEFLNHRRQDQVLSQIPVVMLTSRSSDKHRQFALYSGANGYFTKPYIEQDFLTGIKSLITS